MVGTGSFSLSISIHALREEGDGPPSGAGPGRAPISIHALREEGDLLMRYIRQTLGTFLSTPSARRATDFYYPVFANLGISIHALREEGDASFSNSGTNDEVFLSTPSARRATRFAAPGRHT